MVSSHNGKRSAVPCMTDPEPVRFYGVKERFPDGTDVDRAIEELRLLGYAVVDGGYTEEQRQAFSTALDRAYERQCEMHGRAALQEIDEHQTVRAPLSLDRLFLDLASNSKILAICDRLLSGFFTLNQQNGLINPARAARYNQAAYHRDLPYQHMVTSRPMALSALYCVDPFTTRNGATLVVPGSHKEERFPSDQTVRDIARVIEAPSGHFLMMDCMVYHSGGVNQSETARRAVNHLYALPFIRQPIDLPSLLGSPNGFAPDLVRLLGYGEQGAPDVAAFYSARRARTAKPAAAS